MGGLRDVVIGLVVLASASPGCRYQNMNVMGADSAAPYTNLECFEPGNEEGFSFEVPSCYCNAGIRLRYFASHAADGSFEIRYEYESGFNNEESSDDLKIVSHSIDDIESVTMGSRPLDRVADAELWAMAKDSFTSMWHNYRNVVEGELFVVCTEDRIEADLDTLPRE